MYCSIDKLDLTARVDGQPVAVQTDDRTRAEIEAEPELSVLFALARVLNARSELAAEGHPDAAVHYAVSEEPPPLLRAALVAAGATLERGDRRLRLEPLGPGSPPEVDEIVDRAFAQLARRAAARVGSRDLAIALRMLEDQTYVDAPERGDEARYWQRVLELAALAGELLRARFPGRWVRSEHALVPFAFQLDAGAAMMFPTNRAQRVIEDGSEESLFKLLIAADETIHNPTSAATGRLMPSLRDRRDVDLDEIVWRPVLDDQAPPDLPVIVCGVDGESTFGMIRREALPKADDIAFAEALENLADEEVELEETYVGKLRVTIVSGSFYAAEKLLDREFMQELHRTLGAELLAAAAPARGCLLVAAAGPDRAAIGRFAALARARHDAGGGRAISPAVVLLSGGRVVGYVRGPGDPPPARAETSTARARTVPAAPASEPRHSEPPSSEPASPSSTVMWLLRRLFGRK